VDADISTSDEREVNKEKSIEKRSPKLGAANKSPSDGGLHSGSAILQRFRGRPL